MTNAISKRQRPSRYTDAEIDRGLFAVALASGNVRRASAMLEAQGELPPALEEAGVKTIAYRAP